MKAYQITKPRTMTLFEGGEEQDSSSCKIRVTKCGVSMLDSFIYNGSAQGVTYPIIPVRHAVGVVSETAEGGFPRGMRVAIDPFYPCGKCYGCTVGGGKTCEDINFFGSNRHGFLRDYAIVPCGNLHQIPDQVKDSEAVFVEHISTAISVLTQLGIKPGEHIAIIGASIVGTVLAQTALYYQAIPILVDNFADRLDTARRMGVYYTVNSSTDNPMQKIVEITGGRRAECVAYMSNSHEKIQRALDCVSYGGRICLVGWEMQNEILSANISAIFTKKLNVFGMKHTHKHFEKAINLLANKSVKVAPFISEEIKFDQAPEYFEKIAKDPLLFTKLIVQI